LGATTGSALAACGQATLVLTEKFPTILGANIAGPHINGQTYRDGEWTYDPEYVGTWEVGLKSDFLDGLGRTDLALFYTAITDNQFSIFTGTGFTVLNASPPTSMRRFILTTAWASTRVRRVRTA